MGGGVLRNWASLVPCKQSSEENPWPLPVFLRPGETPATEDLSSLRKRVKEEREASGRDLRWTDPIPLPI